MNFTEYQKKSQETAVYPNKGNNYIYPTLGLVGEAGEIANKVKKVDRDDSGKMTQERRENIKKELGDVLWYVAQLATELGLELDEVAEINLARLNSRKKRGALQGSGDDR